jgi:hypothetical protein
MTRFFGCVRTNEGPQPTTSNAFVDNFVLKYYGLLCSTFIWCNVEVRRIEIEHV